MNSQALSLKSVMDFIKVRLQCAVSLRDDICFDPVQNRETGLPAVRRFLSGSAGHDGGRRRRKCYRGMLDYIRETQKRNIARFVSIEVADSASTMGAGPQRTPQSGTDRDHPQQRAERFTLWLLDDARTAMGKRLLKTWLEQPLVQPGKDHGSSGCGRCVCQEKHCPHGSA